MENKNTDAAIGRIVRNAIEDVRTMLNQAIDNHLFVHDSALAKTRTKPRKKKQIKK